MKNREDYERVKAERLQPNLKDRLPEKWDEVKTRLKGRSFPLMYGGMQGFFNQSRRLLGFERLMMAFATDPDLIKDIANDTADLLIALYDPVLSEVPGDYAMISEDMAYKNGCFVSPAMFREFFMPAYKKLTDFYRDHGIRHIIVDCDGDVMGLIPLLIEGGVTGLHPFEATGRNDIVEVRRRHPRFQILGGISKKIVAQGGAAIDAEPRAWSRRSKRPAAGFPSSIIRCHRKCRGPISVTTAHAWQSFGMIHREQSLDITPARK